MISKRALLDSGCRVAKCAPFGRSVAKCAQNRYIDSMAQQKKKPMTPVQSHRIASRLLELGNEVKAAQRAYKQAYNAAHKLSLDVEAKRLALEHLQSAYVIELGTERDFDAYEKARRKLTRTEKAYRAAAERYERAQSTYDKQKGAKNVKELQLAREQLDQLKPKIIKDAGLFYSASEAIERIVDAKRVSAQLERAHKAYEQAVGKHQKALPKVQKSFSRLQKAWSEQSKYMQSLRRKKLQF